VTGLPVRPVATRARPLPLQPVAAGAASHQSIVFAGDVKGGASHHTGAVIHLRVAPDVGIYRS